MSMKFRVNEIVTRTKKADNPVILRFQNGILSDPQDSCFFRAKDSQQPGKQLAVAATKTAAYQGVINDGIANELVNSFLAIKNGTTGKVRLVEVDQASLSHELFDKSKANQSQLSAEQAYHTLLKNFGGKKAVRQLERNQRMNVSVGVVKEQLEKTLEESILEQEEPDNSLSEANINRLRPPFNADATKINEIFRIEDIIPEELLVRLDEEAKSVVEVDTDQIPISSEFLKERINQVKLSPCPNSAENLNLIKAIIYLDALEHLIKSRSKRLGKELLSNITEKVETDIRNRFSEPNMANMQRTRHSKEKGICHYIALSLLTMPDYEMNVNTLAKELSMARSTVVKYAVLVNAKPVAKTDLLKLVLPKYIKLKKFFTGRRKY